MASIKPIEGGSVHRIQSGQVIVDLCSVVKELVENSLDAGATSIDIRFRSHGLELIEVQDNGSGISKDDYESIALKHYTSKLSSYEDLVSLKTFGFRGEALSSLCALSNVHIITAQEEEVPKGTRLDFETSGKLQATQVVASQRGTTVSVETIFKNLPVRRQELEKNIKREYGKVLALLQAYACISVNVRFSVSNVMAKGKKSIVFATKSNPSTRDNIANVFGAKTLSALVVLNLAFEMQTSAGALGTEEDGCGKQVQVLGHVSRPVFGEGRQTPDRQMFFVNARPCGLPQVAKVFNEVYKTHNLSQSPFIFANVILDTNAYDVNVSPDKRTIMLHDQNALLESIKTSLTELFERQQQTIPQSQQTGQQLPLFKPPTINRQIQQVSGSPASRVPISSNETNGLRATTSSLGRSDDSSRPSANGQAENLIHRFLGRKAQDRVSEVASKSKVAKYNEGVSADKQKLVNKLSRMAENVNQVDDYEDAQDIAASDAYHRGMDVPQRDFNQRIAEQEALARQGTELEPTTSPVDEEPISSITNTPTKPALGVVPNAFDRMRPARTPLQTATITIGSKTTTTTIGNLSSQPGLEVDWQKVLNPPSSSPVGQHFGNSLRVFSAPGNQRMDSPAEESNEDAETPGSPRSKVSDEPEEGQRVPSSTGSRTGPESDAEDVSDAGADTAKDVEDGGVSLLQMENSDSDEEYLDEEAKKAKEDAKVAHLIHEAEQRAARPSQDSLKRANHIMKRTGAKDSTSQFMQTVDTSLQLIEQQIQHFEAKRQQGSPQDIAETDQAVAVDAQTAEERLSLTVSKEDFLRMRIIGQFNLGFIIAARPAHQSDSPKGHVPTDDELFIIDQHASDEKYNFERLQASTIVQNQRLVQPKQLDLTAIEEEIIIENQDALVNNGFLIEVDESGDSPVGQRCNLISLPMSREVTFSTRDLEELLVLLAESPSTATSSAIANSTFHAHIPRPSKVRRMFAMRACRSSVMIGRTLTEKHMEKLVTNMGQVDKPWNCPHGRPTMRHLAGLATWQSWKEGDGVVGMEEEGEARDLAWEDWLRGKADSEEEELDKTGDAGEEEDDGMRDEATSSVGSEDVEDDTSRN